MLEKDKLKILHSAQSVGEQSYGLGKVCSSLVREQLKNNSDVKILTLDNDVAVEWAVKNHKIPKEVIQNYHIIGPKMLYFSPKLIKASFNGDLFQPSLIHQHGMWTGISISTLIMKKKFNLPVVISPHGSLTKNALKTSPIKKRIALGLYEDKNLKYASCIHASSESEIEDIKNYGLKNPVAYIDNGIDSDYLNSFGNSFNFKNKYNLPKHKRIILYLSRIDPLKGLGRLIEIINSLRNELEDWVLIIAGNNQKNHLDDLKKIVEKYRLNNKVIFLPPLFGSDKEDAFASADFFILPSLSEGAPMVILESLSFGVPVITTSATSWNDLNTYNCGWWCENNTESILLSIKVAINLSKKDLNKMGENGKFLIKSKYTWNKLSKKMDELYYWLNGVIEKPDFII